MFFKLICPHSPSLLEYFARLMFYRTLLWDLVNFLASSTTHSRMESLTGICPEKEAVLLGLISFVGGQKDHVEEF